MKFALSFTLVLALLIPALAQNSGELSGYARYRDNSPARGVVLSIGSFSVATDANGYYRMAYLSPGMKTVAVTPPKKVTRTFKVVVNSNPTKRDFTIDW